MNERSAVEPDRLADPQPGSVEQLEQGPVTQAREIRPIARFEQLDHLSRIEGIGQPLRLPWQVDERCHVGPDELLGIAEAVEGPDGRSLATQARGAEGAGRAGHGAQIAPHGLR